jgi:hypothetical protein
VTTPPRSQSNTLLIVGIIAGLLVPIIGLIIAIVLMATNRVAQGLWVLLASIVGWLWVFTVWVF